MAMKKVLLFVDRMRVGGIQVLLVDLLKNFDQEQIQYDLLVLDDGIQYELEEEAIQAGATIYKLDGIWVRKPQDYLKYCRAMKAFFQEHHDYIAVHIHTGPKNYFILKYGKQYGIPIRIAHAHNTGYQTKSRSQQILGNLFKYKIKKYATHYVACSDLAGEWMFGDAPTEIIPNGVDINAFQFNPEKRDAIRSALGVETEFVIGNVGRFTPQKNHTFLLDIFAEVHRRNPRTTLLLVGIGETMDEMKQKAEQLGIDKSVQFLGFRSDVQDLIQGMDVFVMPSLYEGFPVTAVEAQVAGLPCVFSDTITREVKLMEESVYIALEESVSVWAEYVERLVDVNESTRVDMSSKLRNKGFAIVDMARRLEELYGS